MATEHTSKRGRVIDAIRADVLSGVWPPGSRVPPGELAERYATSTTVIREALTRLAGENFLTTETNRGFFVPALTEGGLRDITDARCLIEGRAIELAIERGDVEWEGELIAAHHLLARTPRRTEDDPAHTSPDWLIAHRAFHEKLIEACGVPALRGFARQLANATELFRRWSAPDPNARLRDVEGEHRDILEAVLARDAKTAVTRLRAHFQRTSDIVLHRAHEQDSARTTQSKM
jgi:DNA-binding GntR family transcriptional regulator